MAYFGHFYLEISLVMWLLTLLKLVFLAKSVWAYSSLADSDTNLSLLSRQRRFLVPDAASDWTFTVKFTLVFPLEGLDSSFEGNVPFTFTFNPSR